MSAPGKDRREGPRVALFVTCLVDLFRPSVGFAALRLLEDAGCRVEVPRAQTCCGQPAYNSGDRADARALAIQTLRALEGYDYVVVPSSSCAGMIAQHYPTLLSDDPEWSRRARRLAARCFELTAFLVDVLKCDAPPRPVRCAARATYHDSCSSLREAGVRAQPRHLLAGIEGLELQELADAEVCCGFGGTFCVKYPEISVEMVRRKAQRIAETGADLVLAADLGCLLNIAGRLARENVPIAARHVAEVLAGMTDQPAIGQSAIGHPPAGARRRG